MCIYIYIHTYTYIYIHTISINIYVYVYMCIYIYIYIYICVFMYSSIMCIMISSIQRAQAPAGSWLPRGGFCFATELLRVGEC